MAKIEELINQIADTKLRQDLAFEVSKLKSGKKFGLLFEEHIPENVQIPNMPITVGSKVARRGSNNNQLFTVKSIFENGTCLVVSEIGDKETIINSNELVIIKRFGEPIYPTLKSVERVTKNPEKPYQIIINSENFHALQLLEYTCRGQVDVIYIDPPYNTGARDWKYNNDFVDKADQYRHSKWLAMMKRRIRIARRLLKPEGVLIVAIDDNENPRLQMLLEEELPEREISPVVIVQNPRGNITNNFARTHEYALFVIPRGKSLILRTSKENQTPRKLRRWGHNSTRVARPTMFYPIYIKDGKIIRVGESLPLELHPTGKNVKTEGGEIEIWPIDQNGIERRWNFGLDTINEELDRIIPIEDKNGIFDLFITEEDTTPKTVWTGGDWEAGKHGASLVKSIVGKEFPYPKSLYTVKNCLEILLKNNPNALIVDFFGGSGTTLHATCLLNSEDNGNRRCILVTNNEVSEKNSKQLVNDGIFPGNSDYEKLGICESITFPRCKYSINGERDDGTKLSGKYINGRELKKGFDENLEYFKLDFLEPNAVAYREKLNEIIPILWLISGSTGEYDKKISSPDWLITENSKFAVLINESAFSEFHREIKKHDEIKFAFLITDSKKTYQEMVNCLPKYFHTRMLYSNYLENFHINSEGN